MIYTLTCNPSLDYRMGIDNLRLSGTNRSIYEAVTAGGKGINVSVMLSHLGVKSKALGFVAGFTGEEIVRQLGAAGCEEALIRLPEGQSRINVKLQNRIGEGSLQETEINAGGPEVDGASLSELMRQIDGIRAGDMLVLSGSIPRSLPATLYRDVMELLCTRDVRVIVDAEGELFTHTLKYRPFLIKPNRSELAQLFGVHIRSRADAIPYAQRLQESGARNVLVSFGGAGALLVAENRMVYEADAPEGRLRNAVGSGDSMVAGFLSGYLNRNDAKEAFYMGLSAGSASAFSDGFATKEQVLELFEQVAASVVATTNDWSQFSVRVPIDELQR